MFTIEEFEIVELTVKALDNVDDDVENFEDSRTNTLAISVVNFLNNLLNDIFKKKLAIDHDDRVRNLKDLTKVLKELSDIVNKEV